MAMIGIIGGTFDPIHFGHLNLAIELKEKEKLQEVWFIPAKISPFPKESAPVSGEDRLAMIKLAIRDIPDFKVFPIELERESPSYTIDTLDFLQKQYPNQQFTFLLGEDVALDFYLWKEALHIIQKVPLLVGCRQGVRLKEKIDSLPAPHEIKQALEKGLRETSMMDISATELRKRLNARKYVGHLIPRDVLDFICENQLYYSNN